MAYELAKRTEDAERRLSTTDGLPSRNGALLTADRVAYDDGGRVVEVGHHIYRASRYVFETTLFSR